MVTALTGTVFSFAYGELERSMTPASFQFSFCEVGVGGAPESIESSPAVPCLGPAIAGGIMVAAAEAINVRRENGFFIGSIPSGFGRFEASSRGWRMSR